MCYFTYLRLWIAMALLLSLGGCAFLPQNPNYQGPPPRPVEIDKYYEYTKEGAYISSSEEVLSRKADYIHKKLVIETKSGTIIIDYFAQHTPNPNLIFVFPVLGGKNIIADYFARYFAEYGFDTAIVNRNDDFKDANRFYELEEIFRQGLIRDRIAMDFFEKEYGKNTFGSFGISRGAINVAMTAGVDPRLKYNVLAMGGTDLVNLFRDSSQKGVKKYRNRVLEAKSINKEEFYESLKANIKTDPENLAQYMNAKDTLMFLALFDSAVPFKYGERLRVQIGKPPTIYLVAGHYTSILYTQYAKLLLPTKHLCFFPTDYIESEALAFYRRKFQKKRGISAILPYRILQMPFNFIGTIFGD